MRISGYTRLALGVCASAAMLGGCSLGSHGAQGALPYMQERQRDCMRSTCNGRRQDHARRLHRAGEPQLQQPVPRLSRARIPSRKAKTRPAKRSNCSPRSSAHSTRSITPCEAMFAACNGTGQAAGHRLPDERIQQRVGTDGGLQIPAVRLRAARSSRSRTSTWRTKGRSPTGCSSRSSTRASSRISTSSPRRQPGASICRAATGVARTAQATQVATITTQRVVTRLSEGVLRLSDARRRTR